MRRQGHQEKVVWLSADAEVLQRKDTDDRHVIAKFAKPAAIEDVLGVLEAATVRVTDPIPTHLRAEAS